MLVAAWLDRLTMVVLLAELLFQPLPYRDLRYAGVVGQRPGGRSRPHGAPILRG